MSAAVKGALKRVLAHESLDAEAMEAAVRAILGGEATPAQIAAFAVALRMRGETATEIAAAAGVLRSESAAVELGLEGPVLDTCGTGGDGLGTFNISTVSAMTNSRWCAKPRSFRAWSNPPPRPANRIASPFSSAISPPPFTVSGMRVMTIRRSGSSRRAIPN